jgi:zinc/manganese transport system substrate-binding protein
MQFGQAVPRLRSYRSRAALVVALAAVVSGCGSSAAPRSSATGTIGVVAGENFWGSIAQQIGGSRVSVRSIISDPNTDPHQYESDARDADAIVHARVVIENGLGYDDFMDKLLSSSTNAGRAVVKASQVLGISGTNANPHLWYDIPRVHEVAAAIETQFAAVDPADRATFEHNLTTFDASLRPLLAIIDDLRTQHPHAPVAYTERVPGYLLTAINADIKTPAGFAQAIEDGNDPSVGDTQAMDSLMSAHGVRVLLYNAQATSPVTQHVRDLATKFGIPVIGVTETIPPSEHDYQDWQLHQLEALRDALAK